MKHIVAVLGAGSWGTALAKVLCENGHEVRLWGHREQDTTMIQQERVNQRYLPNVRLPETLYVTHDLERALEETTMVLFVVPTAAIREVAEQAVPFLSHRPLVVHAAKGLTQHTHQRVSQVLSEVLANNYRDLVVLSGPSHAEEVARHDLTTITAASCNEAAAHEVQQAFMNHYFRVYTNDDVIGVELGAALKNIIAVGAGALHGLGYGDNAKAALVTRGLAEISRLGVALGAQPLTFSGLSGVGDLVVTCTSVHSRNWRFGDLIGQGMDVSEALAHIGMTVEGVWTTKAGYELAQRCGVDMPITKAIYQVLYEGHQAHDVVALLMARDGRSEALIQ